MRWLRFAKFLPFTFLCGQEGFLLFAPYLALFLVTIDLCRTLQRRQARLALG